MQVTVEPCNFICLDPRIHIRRAFWGSVSWIQTQKILQEIKAKTYNVVLFLFKMIVLLFLLQYSTLFWFKYLTEGKISFYFWLINFQFQKQVDLCLKKKINIGGSGFQILYFFYESGSWNHPLIWSSKIVLPLPVHSRVFTTDNITLTHTLGHFVTPRLVVALT